MNELLRSFFLGNCFFFFFFNVNKVLLTIKLSGWNSKVLPFNLKLIRSTTDKEIVFEFESFMEQLCGSAGILLCVAEIHLM